MSEKKIAIIAIVFLAIIWFSCHDRTYSTLDRAVKSTLNKENVLKTYKYDEEAFVVHKDNDVRFSYYLKENGKWKLGNSAFYYFSFTSDSTGPGMNYYKSSISNRVYVSIWPHSIFNKNKYKNVSVKDNFNSSFYINDSYWNAVIELEEDEDYIVYINDEEYKIPNSKLKEVG